MQGEGGATAKQRLRLWAGPVAFALWALALGLAAVAGRQAHTVLAYDDHVVYVPGPFSGSWPDDTTVCDTAAECTVHVDGTGLCAVAGDLADIAEQLGEDSAIDPDLAERLADEDCAFDAAPLECRLVDRDPGEVCARAFRRNNGWTSKSDRTYDAQWLPYTLALAGVTTGAAIVTTVLHRRRHRRDATSRD